MLSSNTPATVQGSTTSCPPVNGLIIADLLNWLRVSSHCDYATKKEGVTFRGEEEVGVKVQHCSTRKFALIIQNSFHLSHPQESCGKKEEMIHLAQRIILWSENVQTRSIAINDTLQNALVAIDQLDNLTSYKRRVHVVTMKSEASLCDDNVRLRSKKLYLWCCMRKTNGKISSMLQVTNYGNIWQVHRFHFTINPNIPWYKNWNDSAGSSKCPANVMVESPAIWTLPLLFANAFWKQDQRVLATLGRFIYLQNVKLHQALFYSQ